MSISWNIYMLAQFNTAEQVFLTVNSHLTQVTDKIVIVLGRKICLNVTYHSGLKGKQKFNLTF